MIPEAFGLAGSRPIQHAAAVAVLAPRRPERAATRVPVIVTVVSPGVASRQPFVERLGGSGGNNVEGG